MPAKSKAQQSAAAMALKAKRGEMKVSDLKGASKQMYDDMTEEELEDFASTKREDLPKTVSEDVEIMLDGKRYLLEKGDKIILENAYKRSTLRNLLEKYDLPIPPIANDFLDTELWLHEYNRTYSNNIGEKPRITFDDHNYYPPAIALDIGRDRLMFADDQWEKYDRKKKYTDKYDNDTRLLGGSSDLSRHLNANSPHGLSR